MYCCHHDSVRQSCERFDYGLVVRTRYINVIKMGELEEMTLYEVVLSSPLVGSSHRRIWGCETTAEAIVTRLFWPPEIPRWMGVPIR